MVLLIVEKKVPRCKLAAIIAPNAIAVMPRELKISEPAQYLSAFSLGYIFMMDIEFIKIPICIIAMVKKIKGIVMFN